jgi:hypothetical protein
MKYPQKVYVFPNSFIPNNSQAPLLFSPMAIWNEQFTEGETSVAATIGGYDGNEGCKNCWERLNFYNYAGEFKERNCVL